MQVGAKQWSSWGMVVMLAALGACTSDSIPASATASTSAEAPDESSESPSLLGDAILELGAKLGTRIEWVDVEQGEVAVHIDYLRAPEQPGARMAEFFLEHSDNMTFVDARAGAAAQAAQKTVIGQERPANTVRLVIFSGSNALTLDSGRLATLHFRIQGTEGLRVAFQPHGQMFAPPDANVGVVVSDPEAVTQEEAR